MLFTSIGVLVTMKLIAVRWWNLMNSHLVMLVLISLGGDNRLCLKSKSNEPCDSFHYITAAPVDFRIGVTIDIRLRIR